LSRWLVVLALIASSAGAQEQEVEEDNGSDGYTPSEAVAHETLRLTGYVDVGFAVAQGNGSSFALGDTRVPADYAVDAFAPAVNSRGDVASTDSRGLFTNGFLPRSVGIGNRPSFLLNTASADLRFSPASIPLLVFVRLQVMPRFLPAGDATRVDLQQAFGRLSPFTSHEFAVSLGKFDSVFGIEYLENEANLRTGITPSLIARYTTGQSLGIKAFYRFQLPALWSAISLNAAATASGTRIEALSTPHQSLTGVPVGSARLGYELNLQKVQAKLGVSGLYGPRNDQRDRNVKQMAVGADLRISLFGFSVLGEIVRMIDEPGVAAGKFTGLGESELASGFTVTGFYVTAAWTLPFTSGHFDHLTIYGRYDHRQAKFEGFGQVEVDRFTAGLRVDLFGQVAIKAEYLVNREIAGAPDVRNDVFTSSAVFSW
jgi:hypothetical protein